MRAVVASARVVVLAATASGCATTPYPANWAAVDTPGEAHECKDIVGAFSQLGHESQQGLIGKAQDHAARLASMLFPALPPTPVTHVSLKLSATRPSIEAWVDEELLVRAELRADELRCEAGAWRLEGTWTAGGGGPGLAIPAVGATRSVREFRLASDGALIVKESERIAGIVALVPLYASMQSWLRFPVAIRAERAVGPNAPRGVLAPDSPYARLLPPDALRAVGRREQHRVSEQCLTQALARTGPDGTESEKALPAVSDAGHGSRLAGKPVQAFLFQSSEGARPVLRRQWLDRAGGHVPSTKTSRLLKPHWLDPRVAERTVSCLLDAGYVWDLASAPVETRFDYRDP